MVSGLSLNTPLAGFAGLGGTAPTRRETLESSFPGLRVLGGGQAETTAQPDTGKQATSPAPKLASGDTLLAAQQQGQQQGSGGKASGASDELSDEEQAQVAKLKQIDAKVRAHERAHAAVGGAHAGAPSYSYTRGPDGQVYATGGEVAIDIGAESDPEATLQKATQVAAAALAPADPSGQDRAVAAAAAQLRLQALAQIREEKRAETEQKEAERAADKATTAQQQPAPATPGQAAPGQATALETSPGTASPGLARDAAAAYQRTPQVSAGTVPNATGANDNPAAEARIASTGRQLGRLVGLIA